MSTRQRTLGTFAEPRDPEADEPPQGAEETPECPTCGRTDFASERGMKYHHAKAHGESITGVSVECATCSEPKRVDAAAAERYERHFCDDDCRGAWQSENLTGEGHPLWEGGKVVVECAYCGETKPIYPSRVESFDRHFCDVDCMGRWRSENLSGEDSPSWEGGRCVEVECEWCGEPRLTYPSLAEQHEGTFCDRDCQGAWMTENALGEDNPAWKGGRPDYYGPSWLRQRRRAIERDGEACVLCGRTRDAHRDLYGRDIEVHHRTPFRVYGIENHERANRLDNLVTVCKSCHRQVEPLAGGVAGDTEVTADD